MPRPDPSRPWSVAGTPWIVRSGGEAAAAARLAELGWNPPRKLPRAVVGAVPPTDVGRFFSSASVKKVKHYWTGKTIEVPRSIKPTVNGFTIYRGPSRIDGAPIVVVATGFRDPSTNRKTGPMIQTWIMREDIRPTEAVATGADRSICGDCPHRGGFGYKREREKRGGRTIESVVRPGVKFRVGAKRSGPMVLMPYAKGRSCYVVISQAPDSVWKSYHQGRYPFVPIERLPELFQRTYPLRVGSYGEPVAVPPEIWAAALAHQVVWTGYTHGWDLPENQAYRTFLMASVDSTLEQQHADALGWRTFRIGTKDAAAVAGLEIVCPATPEGGSKTTCDSCALCMGTTKLGARSIVVAPHGTGARFFEEREAEDTSGGIWFKDEVDASETYFPPGYFANPGSWSEGVCESCGKRTSLYMGYRCQRCMRASAKRREGPGEKRRPSRMTSDERRVAKRTWRVGARVRSKSPDVWDLAPDGSVLMGPDGKPVMIQATGTIRAFRTKGAHPQVQVTWDQAARMGSVVDQWINPWWNLELIPAGPGPLFGANPPRAVTHLFSYGSNHPAQLSERIGRPVQGHAAVLDGWERVFRGWSKKWGGGTASLRRKRGAQTFGYVTFITPDELARLDEYEGVAAGKYRRVTVMVEAQDHLEPAVAYVSTSDQYNAPSPAYLEAVARTVGSFWSEDGGRRVRPADFPLRNPANPGHKHPRIKLPVSRGQVEGELSHLYHEAGLPGVPNVTWPADLTRTHERRPRRYAQVWFAGSEPRFELAEQTRWLPEPNRIGVLAHEVGHVLDPLGGEEGADLAAEAALGTRITYDERWPGKGLQRIRT